MIARKRLFAPVLLGVFLPVAALTQSPLQLDVNGGSMPGTVSLDAHPGLFPFELIMIVPSTTSGPTPVQLFDPTDNRTLSIGLDLLGSAWATFADLQLNANVQFSLGAQPSLIDMPLFFQAVTFQWLPSLLDRISNPNVIRLGSAGEFRDRGVSMFEQRAFGTALQRPDGKTLIVGGARGQLLAQVATNTTEIYDPMDETIVYGPQMLMPRSLHTQTELSDGRFLIAGGVGIGNDPQADCEIYDPVADVFNVVTSMNVPRIGHTATLLADGRVFVSGGFEALTVTPTQLSAIRDAVDSTEIFDPSTGIWTIDTPMGDPRAGHIALQRPDGKILLCGGASWNPNFLFGWVPTVRSSCDLYDPATGSMTSGPSMNTPRALLEPVEIDAGKWLVAGGMNGLSIIPWNPGNPTATAEIYDFATNSWTSVGSMATARAYQKGWSIGNGLFMLAGGGNGSVTGPTPLPDTEIFDTSTNTFSPGPMMSSGRAAAGIFHTPQGQVFLFGGAATTAMITTTTEWYYF